MQWVIDIGLNTPASLPVIYCGVALAIVYTLATTGRVR
jgi:hypothetical protein